MIGDEILACYRRRKSINQTARDLNVSVGVVRKTLITAGMWSTPLIERIKELSASGMPPNDIADFLGVSTSTVNANIPYQKGTYLNKNKSLNALRIKACREKKKSQQ